MEAKEGPMKVLVHSARSYDEESLASASHGKHELHFTEARLDKHTATLARGYPAICCFVDDAVNAAVLAELSRGGTKLIALRSTGFNNVDLPAAEKHVDSTSGSNTSERATKARIMNHV